MKPKTKADTKELLRRLEAGKPLVIFDTETTGFSGKKDRLLSFSAVTVVYENGRFIETGRVDRLFNPEIYIPKDITAINHISNETVKDCPLEEECTDIILSYITPDSIICGYNVSFDIRFLEGVFTRYGKTFTYGFSYDVLQLAKELLGAKVENHKLGTVAEYLNVTGGLEFHNSIDDVVATARVLEKLIPVYPEESAKQTERDALPDKPEITSVAYWERGDKKRIYVNAKKVRGIFYDLEGKEWHIPDGVDKNYIRTEAWAVLNRQPDADILKAKF